MLGEDHGVGSSKWLGINGRGCTYSSRFCENYGVTFNGILPEHNGTSGGFKRRPEREGEGFLSLPQGKRGNLPNFRPATATSELQNTTGSCHCHDGKTIECLCPPCASRYPWVYFAALWNQCAPIRTNENNAPKMLIRTPVTTDFLALPYRIPRGLRLHTSKSILQRFATDPNF